MAVVSVIEVSAGGVMVSCCSVFGVSSVFFPHPLVNVRKKTRIEIQKIISTFLNINASFFNYCRLK